MSRYLIRHAKAGSRRDWDGDDRDRPLSSNGVRQAAAIADRLADAGITGLWSSSYRRCVATLQPLAERVGLSVVEDDRLAEGTSVDAALTLLQEAGDGAALCTHGDVLPEVIDALIGQGMVLTTAPEWRKASVWVLDGDSFEKAAAEPPPV